MNRIHGSNRSLFKYVSGCKQHVFFKPYNVGILDIMNQCFFCYLVLVLVEGFFPDTSVEGGQDFRETQDAQSQGGSFCTESF